MKHELEDKVLEMLLESFDNIKSPWPGMDYADLEDPEDAILDGHFDLKAMARYIAWNI